MIKHTKTDKQGRSKQPSGKRENGEGGLKERMAKFTGFCLVAVREMAYTFRLVYNTIYTGESVKKITDSPSADGERYVKIVCPICNREFKNDDAVVKCPEEGCSEIYHYTCWHFSHGCIRPGCLSSLENPRNLTVH